jgi:hypothetical protein
MDDRGQAFTLEGFIGGLLVLTAVLFALQTVTVTPSSGGEVDATTQNGLERRAQDVLVTTATNDTRDLSYVVRYWDGDKRTFSGAKNPAVGYGERPPPGVFGRNLDAALEGNKYNIVLVYQTQANAGRNATATVPMVKRGPPATHAVVASYRVTLYDNMSLTGPNATGSELWELDTDPTDGDDGYYPIPNAVDGPIYNVVEIRVVVW